jgi:hypothetical protein
MPTVLPTPPTPPTPPTLPTPPTIANHTPIVSTSGRRWDEAEIANAAQQLASFFGGEVVTLDEDVLS